MAEMNFKLEIERLAAETLALQTVLFGLLFHLQRGTPDPIRKTLDEAADLVESQAIRYGKAASPEHIVKALSIIEEMRAMIIRN
jgi:hypothetical protein